MIINELIDTIISPNSRVAIWIDEGNHYSKQLWKGVFWSMPKKYRDLTLKRIFGTVAENIDDSDIINIEVITVQ